MVSRTQYSALTVLTILSCQFCQNCQFYPCEKLFKSWRIYCQGYTDIFHKIGGKIVNTIDYWSERGKFYSINYIKYKEFIFKQESFSDFVCKYNNFYHLILHHTIDLNNKRELKNYYIIKVFQFTDNKEEILFYKNIEVIDNKDIIKIKEKTLILGCEFLLNFINELKNKN